MPLSGTLTKARIVYTVAERNGFTRKKPIDTVEILLELTKQSLESYRYSGGIGSVGDLDRDVREKCGDPLEIGRRQDFGPIWIYYEEQANFMYYIAFLNGKLQRIVGAACSPDDANCFDLR